jgi:DNA repair exonuclease SbcCD nuclease subunit
MKFLHVADLHLDRPFEGLSQAVGYQPVFIMNEIVEEAMAQRVQALFLVGDNFHRTQPSFFSQSIFIEGLERLHQAGIEIFLTFGNHDNLSDSQYRLGLPAFVHYFDSEVVDTIQVTLNDGTRLAVSGFSYLSGHIDRDMALEFPNKDLTADYHIGLYHGDVNQSGSTYAPTSLTHLQEKQLDYWALGHIHTPQQLADNILYPGTPLGRNIKETQTGVVIGELTPQAGLKTTYKEIAPVRFQVKEVDVLAIDHPSALYALLTASLVRERVFYRVVLTNYGHLDTDLNRFIADNDLVDNLRADGFVIVDLKLAKLTVPKLRKKVIVSHAPAIDLSLTAIQNSLPYVAEIQDVFDDETIGQLNDDLRDYLADTISVQEGK